MNLPYYIAKRIHYQKEGKKNISKPAVKVATIAIAIGLSVMIIAVSIVVGFKKEIKNKAVGFGAHIQITNFDNNNSYEMKPITIADSILQTIRQMEQVKSVQRFVTKPGIIKTNEDFQGMILKGVGEEYDWEFFRKNLVQGTLLSKTSKQNEAIISQRIAEKMKLKLGDHFYTYFMQKNIKARKFIITGIYNTNFGEFDELFVLTNIHTTQKLNQWDKKQYSGIEINIKNFDKLSQTEQKIDQQVRNLFDQQGNGYFVQNIAQLNPQIFSWLQLININVWVILILMIIVAGFNIISSLLILILEKTNFIGILKSIGANNWTIRKIFLYQSLFLVAKGMLWGNIIGIAICFIQAKLHIIPLDPTAYYVNTVPIAFNISYILLLNIGTLLTTILILIAPSYLITKISPTKTIRYE